MKLIRIFLLGLSSLFSVTATTISTVTIPITVTTTITTGLSVVAATNTAVGQSVFVSSSRYEHGPNYSSLTGPQLILDYTGLVTNTDNSYGIVDISGNVTTWKSLAPGPTGRDFVVNGTAPTLVADGINFSGAGRLRHSGLATVFDFMSFPNTLKWTLYAVVNLGTSIDPNTTIPILGNNGASGANRGVSVYMNDGTTSNNAVNCQISAGVGQYKNMVHNDALIANQFFVLCIEVDGSLPLASSKKIYINRVQLSNPTIQSTTANTATSPSFNMEIGDVGNAVIPMIGKIKEIVITNSIDNSTVRQNFIDGLMFKHNIPKITDAIDSDCPGGNVYDILDESRYPMHTTLLRSKANPNIIVQVINDWPLGHVYRTTNQISMRRSVDGGVTWSAKTILYNPASHSNRGSMDMGGHVDPDDGTMHMFIDAHDGTDLNEGTGKFLYHYTSTNDGLNWVEEDLSHLLSFLPSDQLVRFYGNSIKNGTVTMKPFYTTNPTYSPNTRYLLRKDGISPWSVVTVEQTTGSAYRNEFEIVALSSTYLIAICREDYNFEYVQYRSTDNGLTWTLQGAQTFGDNYTYGSPARLKKFQINGNDVIVCYISDRGNYRYKAVYAKPVDLIDNGLSGWNLTTKISFKHFKSTAPVLHPQYGDFSHVNNSIEGIGSSSLDNQTGTATSLSLIWIYTLPTWHYSNLKTTFGF